MPVFERFAAYDRPLVRKTDFDTPSSVRGANGQEVGANAIKKFTCAHGGSVIDFDMAWQDAYFKLVEMEMAKVLLD